MGTISNIRFLDKDDTVSNYKDATDRMNQLQSNGLARTPSTNATATADGRWRPSSIAAAPNWSEYNKIKFAGSDTSGQPTTLADYNDLNNYNKGNQTETSRINDAIAYNMANKQLENAENDLINAKLDPSKIDPKTGNTLGFQEKIKAILNQGNRKFEEAQHPNVGDKISEVVARNQAALDPSMKWMHQDPLAENMGYAWNPEAMKQAGLTDDDIADYQSIRDMHPQMIEDLYRRGFLKAPYREYLQNIYPNYDD